MTITYPQQPLRARMSRFAAWAKNAWRDPAGRQGRLIVLVGLNLLALIVVFTMLVVRHFGDTADHAAEKRAEQVAKGAASQLELALVMIDQGLQRVERRVVEADGRPTAARLKSAHQFPSQLEVSLSLTDAQGNLIMSMRAPNGMEPISLFDREHIRPHMQAVPYEGTYIGRPIIERLTGRWSIPLSRSVRSDDGRFLGVAIALLDAGALGQMLHGVNLGPTDILDVVTDRGDVLVRWPRNEADPVGPIERTVFMDPAYISSDERVPDWPLHVEVGLSRAQIAAEALPFQVFIIGGATVGALLVAFFSALLFGKTREATAQRDEIASRQRHLLAMLDSIPADIFEFDPQDRLVLSNMSGRKSFLGSIANEGEKLRAILARAVDMRRTEYKATDSARWLEDNLTFFAEGGSREERDARDSWRRTYITKLPNGGRVVMRVDISELKRGKAQLRASEARYAELVGSLPDVLMTIGQGGRILYCSEASQEVLGRAPEDVVGRRIGKFIAEHDYATFMQGLDRLRAAPEKSQAIVCEAIQPDGSYRFVQIKFKMLAPGAEAGKPVGDHPLQLTALIRDIHEQHVLAKKLDQEAANLNSVFEATGASILLLDAERRVKMANHSFLFLVGATLDEVVGKDFADLGFGTIPAAAFDEWRSSAPGRRLKPVEFDVDVNLDENTTRVVRVTANPATDATGALSHIVLIGVDDTDRRLAEVRLFDSSRLANLGEMASGVAHEINQPLAIIRLAAESVSEELDLADNVPTLLTDFLKQKLERIANQTERASGIIRDLRTVARKPGTEAHPFDLAEAVRVGADLLREQMRLDRVDFDVNLSLPGPQVMGEPGRIQQVVINLVNNARDALAERMPRPERGAIGRITVGVDTAEDGQIVLTVQDNGPGIPAKVLPRLFEPFFTTKPVGKGTGLGLSISYDIVNRMGGKMVADNPPEGGARFRILFPPANGAMRSAA